MKFILILPLLFFMACSSEQVQEAKVVTATGLGEGISQVLQSESNFVCSEPILKCDKPEVAKQYIVEKTCDALGADCFQSEKFVQKSVIGEFICKQAVKIVLPAILPSRHLPERLRVEAGCEATCLDELADRHGPELCERL